ncbi:MAG: hypothetical protein J0M07_03785 [Anaerolineae bacterium]|nr:hypothetical protein [Anaerolineae bacterium]
MTEWLMISGSRQATPEMIRYACDSVRRAKEKGWTVMIGDNPKGVDLAVVSAFGKGLIVASVAAEGARSLNLLKGGRGDTTRSAAEYAARDRLMADMCSIGMFVWNGKSPGTKAAFDYMASLGKKCYLADFSGKKVKLTEANAKPEPPPEPKATQIRMF